MKENITLLKNKLVKNSEIILIFLLLFFFITEAVSKISVFSGQKKFDFQAIVKSLVLFFLGVGLLFQKKKEFFYIIVLILSFSIGQYYILDGFEYSSLIYFSKYIFTIALLGYFTTDFQRPKIKLLNIFEYVLVFNSLLILTGFLFNISFFQSYLGERFGYNGLMVSTATGTYFYSIGLGYFLIRYQKNILKNWKFWLVVISSLLLGTKSVMLVLAMLGIFYILNYINSQKLKLSFLCLAVLAAVGFGYYLFNINPLFLEIKETDGFLTSFLSLRDVLLTEYTLPYVQENWKTINYFFGGVSNFEFRPQMEILDLFFFWGILGGLFYFYFFCKSFFQLKKENITVYFVMITLFIIAFLAGNFFYNASLPIYLLILRESFCINQQKSV